jgi:uncharacterized protein Yka (UPF0111/DUF47 family)
MHIVQKLFGKDEKFFDLLEASAEEARSSVQLLVAILETIDRRPDEKTLGEVMHARRKDKRITNEITEQLCKTFVTPLEREDIEALSAALYRIPKTVEKIGERLEILPFRLQRENFQKHISMLDQATETVVTMVKGLRREKNLEKMGELNEKLQFIEGEADKLMIDILRGLYSHKEDAVKVIALKDLYELIEKVIDRCRDAGNVITHVVMKYS